MSILHQKGFVNSNFPFVLWEDHNLEFVTHWHQEAEIVYLLDGNLQIGINNEVFMLEKGDILFINSGNVHYFLRSDQPNSEIIIQFDTSMLDVYSETISDYKVLNPQIKAQSDYNDSTAEFVHDELEKQIALLVDEYFKRQKAYRMAIKARLYDFAVLLLRNISMEKYSPEQKTKQLMQLELLKKIFKYVEENYKNEITLKDISSVANYNEYYFTRFFKEATGMTFGSYLRDFRIRKAEELLREADDSITDIAFACGFNSIKTFNRVFKQSRGCSPTEYKKAIYEK